MYFRWKNTLAISPWHCHQQLSKVQVILRHILLQRKQQEDLFQLVLHHWQLEQHLLRHQFPLLNHQLDLERQENLDHLQTLCQINRPIKIIPEKVRSVERQPLILIHMDQVAVHLIVVMEVAHKVLGMPVHLNTIRTIKM